MSRESRPTLMLSDKKRALLDTLLREEGLELKDDRIQRRSRDGPLPLSFAQQRLWFLDQYEPGNAIYNIPAALRLQGALNVSALEQSVNEVIRRHEALRTTFAVVNQHPVQRINEATSFVLPLLDLRSLPPGPREKETQRTAAEQAQQAFDLATGPLLVLKLLRQSDDEYVLLVTMHHIVSDGWSFKVFIRELRELYKAYSRGRVASLPEPDLQYADFALWQRNWLTENELRDQLDYWKDKLRGATGVLDLPTDRPRPAFKTYQGATLPVMLGAGLSQRIGELSRREGATPFMTLLAAFGVLLYRYAGQDDILVGAPIANRNRAQLENLIGFFINTLAIRIDLSGDPGFRTLLGRVRDTALEAYAHQDLPFEKLVEELQPERSLSHTPLFQTLFHLQNALTETLDLHGVTASHMEIDDCTAKFDLSLTMTESGGSLGGKLNYNADLFDRSTMERLIGHFWKLLDGIVAAPDERISRLPLLDHRERRLLLQDWSTVKAEYPEHQSIHTLFEKQTERAPHAIAAVMGDRRLTYEELNTRANRLAHFLRDIGVGAEARVAICMERSLEMLVGLLAILKAGGAYVPIEPTLPKHRLEFMIRDAAASVALTQYQFVDLLPRQSLRIVVADRISDTLNRYPSHNLIQDTCSDNLAYVMYTSGSTGSPKGVEVLHRGVVRLLFGVDYAELDSKQGILQMAPAGFDASTFEIWGALLHGGTSALLESRIPAPDELRDTIERNGVTTLWLTASLYNSIVDDDVRALSGIEQILIGGETLSAPHVLKGRTELSAARFINGYGPTESTTFACCYQITGNNDCERSIPIGRAISNTRVYLLDANMNPAPIGVVGEIHIGGDGLARGYSNRPDLTAERFLPDPHSGERGRRLYRTGDLARYRSDGVIEFTGRSDNQVKLRGYRVEPGEIEVVLRSHPEVKESAVVLHTKPDGEKQLIAYISPAPGSQPIVADVRNYLRTQLPDYMIPASFLLIERFPLTPNGKVDRQALPNAPRRSGAPDSVPPRDPIEEVVADIFTEVLGVEPIGVDDNFFDLGGHSLLATQVASRVRKTFHVSLPLRAFFAAPTVAELSQVIVASESRPGQAERIASLLVEVKQMPADQLEELLKQREDGTKPADVPWR